MLIYLHGFNSSPQSFKARLLRERLEALGHGHDFACPALDHRPAEAMAQVEALLANASSAATTLVGSSLGGFYATWLAERYGMRAALINPAVRPYDLLSQYLGAQKNLYTAQEYELTPRHLDELRALEVEAITPERYFLLVETGDEVLDYRAAVARYRGCQQRIIQGGDHGCSDFGRHLDVILSFAGVVF
jgi:uncharacterized protein